ncbi:MAG: hypothetical protein RID09_20310 [Coleofasciculus sp. G1-WW12-02]|uniref:hypothetical protein n=1 Tax=Coleofasciculus sp. G1-WW12-02 TaxID=3068483 RepID=UPI0033015882
MQISQSLVLGSKDNLLRILPLLLLLSSCNSSSAYYRNSQVEILGQRGNKSTIRYSKTGIVQEVPTDALTFPD